MPIVLPLAAGAALLLVERWWPRGVNASSIAATAALLALSLLLLRRADGGAVHAYLLGNWRAPFGIALALDRLAALMLLLASVVALASVVYASAGSAARSPHFHTLFQFQLAGLNGAFLAADLFNLFVFFEVLLAASYALLLHGGADGRRERSKAALHYVVFNLTGSALFLVAVSLLYGVTGTLNMADLAERLPALAPQAHQLAQSAALLLLVVFAVKAALLPLYFWLPDTYAAATPAVAALFAIHTKVGVYALLRTTTLVFAAGPTAGVAQPALPALALATMALAAVGVLAAPRLRALVAYSVVVSAGLLLSATGLGTVPALAAGLFYLVHTTVVAALLFLLVDRVAAVRGGSDLLQPQAAPPRWGLLGAGFFVAALAAAGMPPLAGFLGKAMLLQAAGGTPWAAWTVAIVLASSLALVVAFARAGAIVFWTGGERVAYGAPAEPARRHHHAAMGWLLLALLAASALAGPLGAYTQRAAAQLFDRGAYQRAVLDAPPVPPAIDVRREMRERGRSK
jgi:multicomponent K+:H+ antiporter subunit D